MPPNPSHLEAVDPVVVGMARAAGTAADGRGAPRFDGRITLPILIHGDAAFPGQGVVAETLNLSRLAGYDTGGTIHIIANNQLGFTATPEESFSTSYASGLARGFKIPIMHVNADDPVACLEAARLAWEYRPRFSLDFLIDLVGYRRYGHNEGDEPAFTQPRDLPDRRRAPDRARALSRRRWSSRARSPPTCRRAGEEALRRARARRTRRSSRSRTSCAPVPPQPPPGVAAQGVSTGVPLERLRDINDALLTAPDGFTFHRKLERGRERRKAMLAEPVGAHPSTGRRRRSWRWPRSSPTASRSASPARTSSAARSAIATPCTTTR